MNISFGGASIKRPGAYSTVDSTNMVPMSLGAFNVLAIVGTVPESATIEAGKISYFNPSTAQQARLVIGDCDLMDCMNIAWGHGADLIAVSPIKPADTATGVATDAEWQSAIDLLGTEYVDGIIPVTTAGAIQTKIDTHCTTMSGIVARRERRAFYGHATGLTSEAVIALQATLSTELGTMASPSVYYYDSTGALVLKPSYYLASAYAGLWASKEPQDPITYDYVKFPKLEKTYTGDEIIQLLGGHIAPVEVVRNKGFRIVQGITLSADEDLTKAELSVSTLKVVMSRNMRDYMEEKYVGKAGVKGIEVTIYNDAVTMIERYMNEQKWISDYVKESVVVRKDGTAFWIDWEGKPTLPINNFLITSHFTL
jgi:phage tail sheath gpL-like